MTTADTNDWPSEEAFKGAASMLVCEARAIKAVAKVESGPHGAFLDDGTPVILYEPHVFHRLTQGRYAGKRVPGSGEAKWGVLSYPTWRRGWYGPVSVQHQRLAAAVKLNRAAALMACSWGMFQIMGMNYQRCGFDDVQRFVNAMYRSVDDHLWAFVRFVRSDHRLVDALRDLTSYYAEARRKNAETFALHYNGKGYKANRYDSRILDALAEFSS